MKNFILICSLLFLTGLLNSVKAQLGSLDPEFNTYDNGTRPNQPGFSEVNSTLVQPDGKIIMGGFFNVGGCGPTQGKQLVRLNSDGVIDGSFNPGSVNSNVFVITMQTDGKMIVAGNFTSIGGLVLNRIARLNPDGTLDSGFNPGLGFNHHVRSVNIQPDGKLIVGGLFTTFNGNTANRIVRLNPDGSQDATFNPGNGFNNYVYSTALMPDGRIVVGGQFTAYNGSLVNRIARLNPDGSLDATFSTSAGFDGIVNAVAVQSDGKILAGGDFNAFNGVSRSKIARLEAGGSLDAAFSIGTGFNAAASIKTLLVQPDGRILVGGSYFSFNGGLRYGILRLLPSGSEDLGMNTGVGNLAGFNGTVFSISLQTDGKIVAGGNFDVFNLTSRRSIARLNENGSIDGEFNTSTGFNSNVWSLKVQPDGKIIAGGSFLSYNGIRRNGIARLNADGTLDQSFNNLYYGINVYTMELQSDGKIVIGGSICGSVSCTSAPNMYRLNSDGSIDPSFNVGSGFSSIVFASALQPDGKIIAGGDFSTYNGVSRACIARLNPDGSLDAGFNPGSGFNGRVETVYLQSDGKIIVGGQFTAYNGSLVNRIARLNPNGSLDATFNTGSGFNQTVRTINMQSDGKILVGGAFTSVNGVLRNRIARLNTDGSLDLSFSSNVNNSVISINYQVDGKIIIGGTFTSVNGSNRFYVARLLQNGATDLTWFGTQDPGFGDGVLATVLQADGKIVAGGSFSCFNSTSRRNIVRLLNENCNLSASAQASNILCNGGTASVTVIASGGTAPYTGTGTFQRGAGTWTFNVTDANGCSASTNVTISQPSALSVSATSGSISCYGGTTTVTVSASGGTAPYAGTGTFQRGAGTWTFNVTDANGCAASATVTINQPAQLQAYAANTPILCNGGTSTVGVTFSGGTGVISGIGNYTVSAGTYTYNIVDGNGCTASTSITVTQPAQLQAYAANTPILCNGGTATVGVTFSGGTGVISGIGNYTVTAGTYTYNIVDGNGCTASTTITVTQPTAFSISASPTSSSSATANASGGTGPYIYLWSNGQLSQSVNGLQPGTYTVTAFDANGCSAVTSVNVGLSIPLTVNAGGNEIVYYGYGQLECVELNAEVDGGTPPYSVVWTSTGSGGGVGLSLTACPLGNEVFTVTVTDANGISVSDQLSICVVNVECEAGNSGNMKVEMCQIPPGNPNNAHTICIDENAVPAHLAIGCTLGACGELDNCNYLSGMAVQGAAAQKLEEMNPTL
ncbi:MAG: hypothetical protein ACK45H_09040, partial [Bacteroidota bacterium]